MKYSLILVIQLYWKIIPECKRRKCLFKLSCSKYVYQITKNKGLISGLKALLFRVKNCNPYYNITEIKGEKLLITKSGEIFTKKEISEFVFEE